MVQFTYQAKDKLRQPVKGTIEADSRDSALKQVMDLGLFPSDIQPVSDAKSRDPRHASAVFARRNVRRAQVVFYVRQMSDLIGAGVNVLRALMLTARQTRDPFFKEIITRMGEEVRDGTTLSEAMARYPQVFPKVYSNLVRAGETSGKLAEVLERLADLAQRDQDARGQIAASFIYPGLILSVGFLTVISLLTWVVPKMTAIFDDLEQALPFATVLLISLSDFLLRYWSALLVLMMLSIFSVNRIKASTWGRLWLDKLKLQLPVIGSLTHNVEMGRFARTMATLLGNGVAITSALDVTSQVMGNEVIRREVEGLLQAVSHGTSLNGALKRSPVFPETVVTMVAVGEESGQIHRGLARMAEYFENQSMRSIKTITTLVEPVLILLLGLVVGFVVLAMLLPLLQMNLIVQ